MDVTATRKRNITVLVAKAGGPTAFGKLVGRDQVQVSQWTSPTKPKAVGGRLARDLESKLGYERGWLDQPQGGDEAAPDSQSQLVRLDPSMIAITHRVLRELYASDLDDAKFCVEDDESAARFVQVYALRAGLSARPTPEEWVEYGRKLEAIMKPQGALDGRGDGVPTEGTGTKNVAGNIRRPKA